MTFIKDFKNSLRVKYLRKIRYFSQNKFPKINKILRILKNKDKFNFEGWNMHLKSHSPWQFNNKNRVNETFQSIENDINDLIKENKFELTQFKNSHDIFDVLKQLRWRHYLVSYTSSLANKITKSKTLVECGVADGLTMFYAIMSFNDESSKSYLYDSWSGMRKEDLIDGKEKNLEGAWSHLELPITKKNLEKFGNQVTFNQGYIPEVFKNSDNPNEISWLHIDLNSSKPTLEALNFFYPKIEDLGIILFDDYAWPGYEDTRKVIDEFLYDKSGQFFHFPTGQAFFIKIN